MFAKAARQGGLLLGHFGLMHVNVNGASQDYKLPLGERLVRLSWRDLD